MKHIGSPVRAIIRHVVPHHHSHADLASAEPGFRYSQAPRRVYWELTIACGLACQHCRAGAIKERSPQELSRDEAFAVLRALARAEPRPTVVLTGGDPLERPDFYEIIDFARNVQLHVDVAPSVTPKLTRDAVFSLHEHGVGAMSLSLDGSDAPRHDSLRGIPGCFDRTIEAARYVREAQIHSRSTRSSPPTRSTTWPRSTNVWARCRRAGGACFSS
jgi:AdoMet-dependent heme synthase